MSEKLPEWHLKDFENFTNAKRRFLLWATITLSFCAVHDGKEVLVPYFPSGINASPKLIIMGLLIISLYKFIDFVLFYRSIKLSNSQFFRDREDFLHTGDAAARRDSLIFLTQEVADLSEEALGILSRLPEKLADHAGSVYEFKSVLISEILKFVEVSRLPNDTVFFRMQDNEACLSHLKERVSDIIGRDPEIINKMSHYNDSDVRFIAEYALKRVKLNNLVGQTLRELDQLSNNVDFITKSRLRFWDFHLTWLLFVGLVVTAIFSIQHTGYLSLKLNFLLS